MLRVTVSGSFHRHLSEVMRAVAELRERGVTVLSPADPRVIDNVGEFVFVASDRFRSVRLVQDRHLESIRSSDFLWLVCPDGYVGQSAAMEMGFAAAHRIPVLGLDPPHDLTLRQYVRTVPSLKAAVEASIGQDGAGRDTHFLIDPHATLSTAKSVLERIETAVANDERRRTAKHRLAIYSGCEQLSELFSLPTK